MADSSGLSETLIATILDGETNDARFERFANELVSVLEGGVPVPPTSRSWYVGKDGKSLDARIH
jgi:hypothetical protein